MKTFEDEKGKQIEKEYYKYFGKYPCWYWQQETVKQCYERLENEIENKKNNFIFKFKHGNPKMNKEFNEEIVKILEEDLNREELIIKINELKKKLHEKYD